MDQSQQQGQQQGMQQGQQQQQPAQGSATGTTGNNSQEDYGDKGLDFLEKKTGHSMGRDTNEKITDGARGMFEKMTGKNVDSKYSN